MCCRDRALDTVPCAAAAARRTHVLDAGCEAAPAQRRASQRPILLGCQRGPQASLPPPRRARTPPSPTSHAPQRAAMVLHARSLSRLRSVDFYKKIPSDLTEATLAGAGLSIAASVIMALLLVLVRARGGAEGERAGCCQGAVILARPARPMRAPCEPHAPRATRCARARAGGRLLPQPSGGAARRPRFGPTLHQGTEPHGFPRAPPAARAPAAPLDRAAPRSSAASYGCSRCLSWSWTAAGPTTC